MNKELIEVEREIDDIQKEMDELTEERRTICNNLSSIKAFLASGRIKNEHYAKMMKAKKEYNEDMAENLAKHGKLKNERVLLNRRLDSIKINARPEGVENIKKDLQDLKDKYFNFYRDKTRIAYMRNMAKEFIVDIDKIIKNS